MTSTGSWIRPVSSAPGGTLSPRHYLLRDGTEAAVLDIIRLEVANARPEQYQPENWEVSAAQWERLGHLTPTDARAFLRQHTTPGPDLLGNDSDRVLYQELLNHPAGASLCVIEPGYLRWYIRTNYAGNKQARATFNLAGADYDLVVTDPVWERRLLDLPYGHHERAAAGIPDSKTVFLTISLAGPLGQTCYKLVAAVIVL